MRRLISMSLAAAALGAVALAGASAQAATRAWVSGHGTDAAGCGSPANPCRSLQYAHDNIVAAGGEIDIMDPAGYGAISITKAISIVNDGVGTAGVQSASGDAIAINAGPADSVYLKGLNVDGVLFAGHVGINFIGGGNLTISNCVVRHFGSDGIKLNVPGGTISFQISNTIASDNGNNGVRYTTNASAVTVTGVLDGLTASNNASNGVEIDSAVAGTTDFTIEHSNINHNAAIGVSVQTLNSAVNRVAIDSTHINYNQTGVEPTSTARVRLWNSTAVGNSNVGTFSFPTGNGDLISEGDNLIKDNAVNDIVGTLTPDTLN